MVQLCGSTTSKADAIAHLLAQRNLSFASVAAIGDDVNDIEMLREKGVTIDVEPKVGLDANTQAWFKDPDGNAIELMQLSPISPQKAVAEGREPVIPDPSSLQ